MMSFLFIAMAVFGCVMFCVALLVVKERKTRIKWAVFWSAFVLIFIANQEVSFILLYLGFSLPFNVIVIVSFGAIFYLLWVLFRKLEAQDRRLKRLVQKLAMEDHK